MSKLQGVKTPYLYSAKFQSSSSSAFFWSGKSETPTACHHPSAILADRLDPQTRTKEEEEEEEEEDWYLPPTIPQSPKESRVCSEDPMNTPDQPIACGPRWRKGVNGGYGPGYGYRFSFAESLA
jgi:hypothetical protein